MHFDWCFGQSEYPHMLYRQNQSQTFSKFHLNDPSLVIPQIQNNSANIGLANNNRFFATHSLWQNVNKNNSWTHGSLLQGIACTGCNMEYRHTTPQRQVAMFAERVGARKGKIKWLNRIFKWSTKIWLWCPWIWPGTLDVMVIVAPWLTFEVHLD